MSLYNPSRPWVYKIRSDKRIASDLFFYMDDDKLNSFFALECWEAAKRVCQIMSYLRIQDAYRQRMAPGRVPGGGGISGYFRGDYLCLCLSNEDGQD